MLNMFMPIPSYIFNPKLTSSQKPHFSVQIHDSRLKARASDGSGLARASGL